MYQPPTTWGDDRARPRLLHATLALGSDPDTVYAFGESDGSVQLEAWHAETGVRVAAWAVARGATRLPGALRRGEHDDEVLLAVRGMARTEVIAVDLATGATRGCRVLPRSTSRVLAIARDGASAAGGQDAVTNFIDTPGRFEAAVPVAVTVSPSGALTAMASVSGRAALLIDGRTGARLAALDAPGEARVESLAFASGETTLWAMGGGEVVCWDLSSRVLLGRWRAVPPGPFLAFSPDGLRALLEGPLALAVGHERPVDPRGAPWDAVDARVSPDGRRVAAGSGVLSWHDLARDVRVELAGVGHTAAIRDLAVSRDGARVASCAGDGTIRVWEAATGACAWQLEGSLGGYDAVAFAPDGRTLYAVAAWPRRLTSWSLADGGETTPRELPFPHEGLRVSPDGRTIIARRTARGQAADGCVVDVARFAPAGPWLPDALDQHEFNPRAGVGLGLSDEGAALEVLGFDVRPTGASLDLATGEELFHAADLPLGEACRDGDFSPDGRWFVTVTSGDDRVALTFHAVRNGYQATARHRFYGAWGGAALAVGNDRAAIGEADGAVTVLDRGERRRTLSPQLRSQATAMALSPDEKTLYVGTHHGQVVVFPL